MRSSTVANVRWRGDRVPLAYEPPDNAGAFIEQDCMYHDLIEATGAPLPIDFGDIRIDDNDPMDGQLPFIVAGTKYTAEYQGGAYTVTPVVPSQFLLLSQPRPLDMVGPSLVSLISLTGLGSPLTGGANWPLSSESTNPIPFQLVPASMPGDVDLALPQTLATPAQDLIFRWTPVQTGITNSMRVRVRIVSGTHEIFCELVESTNDAGIFTITDNIPIAASLLERLRIAVGAGTNVPIYFERTQRAGLYAPGPVNEAGTSPYVHSVTLWIRHTLIGELRL